MKNIFLERTSNNERKLAVNNKGGKEQQKKPLKIEGKNFNKNFRLNVQTHPQPPDLVSQHPKHHTRIQFRLIKYSKLSKLFYNMHRSQQHQHQ